MSLRIATNVQSLTAQRFLSNNHDLQDRSLEKLSSGSRINRAGDDAAGLAISENLKAAIRSMKAATRNANDGISLVQVAEGSTNEISNILTRMRELSIQTASDTVGDVERGFVDKEIQHLKAEIDRIAKNTEFNGFKLLDGSSPLLEVQVGMHNSPDLDRFRFDTQELVTTLDALGLNGISNQTKESSQANLDMLDKAIVKVNDNRSSMGALQNRIMSTVNNNQIYIENLMAANSRIRDTDMAEETSNLTKANILTQANVSVLGQANANPQLALRLLS
jgi:flagellin